MDPASIISVIAVAAHSINKTKQFVESIKGAPEVVTKVVADLSAIKGPLQDFNQLALDFHRYGRATQIEIANSLGPAVSSCQETVTELDDLLRPYVRSNGVANFTTWRRMSFGFKEHKVLILKSQLEACKSSLSLAAIRVSIAIQNKHKQQTDKTGRDVRRMMKHFDIETSTATDSEYTTIEGRLGYRHEIAQWLAETRTVISEHELEESLLTSDDEPDPRRSRKEELGDRGRPSDTHIHNPSQRQTTEATKSDDDEDDFEPLSLDQLAAELEILRKQWKNSDSSKESRTAKSTTLKNNHVAEPDDGFWSTERGINEDNGPSTHTTSAAEQRVVLPSNEYRKPALTPTRKFSMVEVSKHRSKGDLFMVINHEVYDLSSWMDEHPGGKDILLKYGGDDVTIEFDMVGHSDEAREILKDLFIGDLKK